MLAIRGGGGSGATSATTPKPQFINASGELQPVQSQDEEENTQMSLNHCDAGFSPPVERFSMQ
jgi:hypothetical protein